MSGPARLLRRMLAAAAVLAAPAVPAAPAAPVAAAVLSAPRPAGLELLALSTSPDRRIVDTAGRDVLLRGANVNSLGEYWQGVEGLDPTVPVTAADWDQMAAHGFSAIRLLVTWSRIEPVRGVFDDAYLAQVDAYVREAAAHGIYSVIDMHQDAYTAALSTTDPADCPPGTSPARGWDGAPAWAVIDDGASTCLTGTERNSSPAVITAWNSFYRDRDGIRTEFAAMWGHVARYFAGRPEVAGFDLLNEPETSMPSAELTPLYQNLLADAIGEIRAAQAGAAFDHIVFVEPTIPAGNPSNGIVIPDPGAAGTGTANIAASVHNYSESIGGGSIEGLNDTIETITAGLGVANWGGEYGFWDTSPATLAKARRYAADEDAHLWGGAWWQWRQSCGDPHAVAWDRDEVTAPAAPQIHLNIVDCPANTDLGPNEDFLAVLGRGYPRAAPGRLTTLRSDPVTGAMEVRATAAATGGTLVIWTPTAADAAHQVSTEGLTAVVETAVDGGRIITAAVTRPGPYVLRIGPTQTATTATTDPGDPPAAAAPAAPADAVTATASYTG